MSLRMGIRPLLVCSALLALAPGAFAQSKVAVIDMQQAVFATAEIQQANVVMTAKYKPRSDALDALTAQGVQAQKKLQDGADTLSDEQSAALEAQVARLQRDATRQKEDLEADVQRDRDDILSKASERMGAVVKKLAEDRGYDVVTDVHSLVYFKPAADITKDATAAYDLAYPLAAKPGDPAKPAGK
jgi:outer membrane protein